MALRKYIMIYLPDQASGNDWVIGFPIAIFPFRGTAEWYNAAKQIVLQYPDDYIDVEACYESETGPQISMGRVAGIKSTMRIYEAEHNLPPAPITSEKAQELAKHWPRVQKERADRREMIRLIQENEQKERAEE